MATRRKKPDEPPDGGTTAVAEANGTHAQPTATGQPAPKPNRPAASFAASSDRTTRVEVAVWSKLVKVTDQEEYTQYSLTLSRSWRDKDGNWFGNASFRIHDVPVLLYLLQQAYHWCLAQRTQVTVESIGDVPF